MSGTAGSLEFGNTTPKGLMATDSNPSPIRIEAILKKLGDDCMEDLRQDRVTSVYRLTTKAYQQETTREQFEEMVHKVAKVRMVNSGQPESKVRKAPDGKSYEYYCTSQTSNATGAVNLALIFVEADGDWRIGEFELKQDN